MATTVFLLEEIQDSDDVARVRKALLIVDGVSHVEVEIVTRLVIVEHDPELASVEALSLRLDHLGFLVTVV